MKTITKTINVYRFPELSERAKDRVRRGYQDMHDEWWDCIYEQAKEDGKARGFDIDGIHFSGFASQGDGACWTGRIDPKMFLQHWLDNQVGPPPADYPQRLAVYEALKTGLYTGEKVRIVQSGRYTHAHSMGTEGPGGMFYPAEDDNNANMVYDEGPYADAGIAQTLDALDCNDGSAWMDAFFEEMLDAARTYANGIYRDLEQEYDYLTSDEYIAETCADYDNWFDEDGEIVDAPDESSTATEKENEDGIR